MKRTIIIILAMVFFMAIPALASTPTTENAPAPTSEDQMFFGLKTLSEEELIEIIGNAEPDMDGQFPGFEDQTSCGLPNFNSGNNLNNSNNINNSNNNNNTNTNNYNPYWDWALQAWRINWMRYHCPNGFFVE